MATTTHDRTDMRSAGTGVHALRRRGPDGPPKEGASVLRTDLVRIVCTLVVLSLVPPVYAAHKFPDYPVRPAGDYAVTAERAGLIIGVQPVEDLKDQKTYFNTELTPKGFIPVFVVIQNGSSGDSFLFDRTNVGYAGISNASSPNVGSKAVDTMALFGGLLWLKLVANASQVQQNLLKIELQSKTLSPGTSVHGFLYIPVPKNAPRPKIRLQVPVTRAGTSETYVLNLIF